MKMSNFGLLFQAAAEKGVLLLIGMICAMIMCNSTLKPIYEGILHQEFSLALGKNYFTMPLHAWVNDFLMAIFFWMIGMDIKREMIEGHLSTWSQRLLPFVAATFGVLTPMLIYYYFNWSDALGVRGWAIPTATDIAFALAMFALFGSSLPVSLRVFLAALAIIDDFIAVIIIAIFYTESLSLVYILYSSIILLLLRLITKNINLSMSGYMLAFILLWYCFLSSGVHASIAGVVLGFSVPLKAHMSDISPLKHLERMLQPYSSYFILPVFAFANSGLSFEGINVDAILNNVTLGIILGLFFGKQIGIFGIVYIMSRLGIAKLPANANLLQFYGVSVLCGIGFTMSLFISILAYSNTPLIAEAQLGVLCGSALSVIWGFLVLYIARYLK